MHLLANILYAVLIGGSCAFHGKFYMPAMVLAVHQLHMCHHVLSKLGFHAFGRTSTCIWDVSATMSERPIGGKLAQQHGCLCCTSTS